MVKKINTLIYILIAEIFVFCISNEISFSIPVRNARFSRKNDIFFLLFFNAFISLLRGAELNLLLGIKNNARGVFFLFLQGQAIKPVFFKHYFSAESQQ